MFRRSTSPTTDVSVQASCLMSRCKVVKTSGESIISAVRCKSVIEGRSSRSTNNLMLLRRQCFRAKPQSGWRSPNPKEYSADWSYSIRFKRGSGQNQRQDHHRRGRAGVSKQSQKQEAMVSKQLGHKSQTPQTQSETLKATVGGAPARNCKHEEVAPCPGNVVQDCHTCPRQSCSEGCQAYV